MGYHQDTEQTWEPPQPIVEHSSQENIALQIDDNCVLLRNETLSDRADRAILIEDLNTENQKLAAEVDEWKLRV